MVKAKFTYVQILKWLNITIQFDEFDLIISTELSNKDKG